VVGPGDAESWQRYWRREGMPFIGLPDPDRTAADRFGQEVGLFGLGLPAQMLIDRSGTLRFVHYGHSMADIPSNREVLNLLASLPP